MKMSETSVFHNDPIISKILSRSRISTVVEIEDGSVVKTINNNLRSYPHYLFVENFCSHTNILRPTSVEISEERIIVRMEKGQPLTKDSQIDLKQLLVNLLDALCHFERFNLIYGDIKAQNIVLDQNQYRLIDFDILVNRDDNTTLTQTYHSLHGYATEYGLKTNNYNNFHEALYALAYTLMICAKDENRHFFGSDTMGIASLTIGGMCFTFPACTTAIAVNTDYLSWIEKNFDEEWRPFVLGLVGKNRFSSFAEARAFSFLADYPLQEEIKPSLSKSLPQELVLGGISYTRDLYDYACKHGVDTHNLFYVYNLYYKYGHHCEDKSRLLRACSFPCSGDYRDPLTLEILAEDRGLYLTEIMSANVEARLFLEYLAPGTWPLSISLSFEEVEQISSKWPDQPARLLVRGRSVLNPSAH